MKVLFIDGVGVFGGACRSLYENLKFLRKKEIEFFFIIQNGTIKDYYRKFSNNIITSIGLTRFDNTEYSYYRGLRWLVLLREIFYLPFTIIAMIRAKLSWGKIDIIHVNEITEILSLLIAKLFFRKSKVIVHCRSIYRKDKSSYRNKLISFVINNFVDILIAIDSNVKSSLPKFHKTFVINNSFSIEENNEENNEKNIDLTDILQIGYVGTISEMKGIYDLIEALKIVKKKSRKFKLKVAGSQIHNNRFYLSSILQKLSIQKGNKKEINNIISDYNLKSDIIFLGHIKEISGFYKSIDVLCFPSRLNAPGRPIIEASYFKKPSIACISEVFDDTFINQKTGIAVKPANPEELANAIIYLIDNKNKLKKMGDYAYANYKKYNNPEINSNKIYNLYKTLI